ncbi:MAG TPA: hypothetical protein VFA31_02900 [Candidatus Polarisedimenticolia bacterium]|nr:hypothetical protein [Candidatus Polarisedimenticolia bacterium]
MRGLRFVLLAGLLASACAPAATGERPNRSGDVPTAATIAPTASPVPLTIPSSSYGALEIKTLPGDSCDVAIKVEPGTFGDGPPKTLAGKADATGALSFTYAAPLIPAGSGRHEVTCTGAQGPRSAWSPFNVALKTLDPKSFTARIEAVDPIAGLDGLNTKLEPSLVAARDASVARLSATLVKEWAAATRGLGTVKLVPSSADIVIYVVPGRSNSLHLTSPDGSQRILVFMVDDLGPVSTANSVAVALHELGHIWCCRGDDAGPDGHWLKSIPDPLLQGVDRFGLMTHPVTCLVFPGFVTCPNRFSERELHTMGFAEVPPPPADPCVTQANALVTQIGALDASLASTRVTIDATNTQLRTIEGRIAQIETQYPNGAPPDVYATYTALIDQYNRLVAENNDRVDTFNLNLEQRNALARQPLRC